MSGGAQRYRERLYRHEYKYLLDPTLEGLLRLKAGAVLRPDPHVRGDGSYLIRSVYFDDASDRCLAENLSGTDPRSKYRVRYYNDDPSRISLEKKSKVWGLCRKEACLLTREECKQLLKGAVPKAEEGMDPVKQKLLTELLCAGMRPVVIVTYERIPFVYSGGNVRVTFDRKLTASRDLNRFLTGDYLQRPVLPLGQSLLEVKWDEVFPLHIRETLQTEHLQWTAFSKYAICRTCD